MRKIISLFAVALMGVSLTAAAWAASGAEKECVSLCKKAAKLIKKDGIEKGKQAINDKKGPFVTKETYVFLMDMNANMIAHPIKPGLMEKGSLIGTTDSVGKPFFAEFIKVAANPGEGWVAYMWPKPGEEKPSSKNSYIYRVPGTNYFVGAGVYK